MVQSSMREVWRVFSWMIRLTIELWISNKISEHICSQVSFKYYVSIWCWVLDILHLIKPRSDLDRLRRQLIEVGMLIIPRLMWLQSIIITLLNTRALHPKAEGFWKHCVSFVMGHLYKMNNGQFKFHADLSDSQILSVFHYVKANRQVGPTVGLSHREF